MALHSTHGKNRSASALALLLVVVLLVLPAAAGAQETPQPQPIHVVAAGDTVYSIAARYGVPASALLEANKLGSAGQVRPGMRLVVPAPLGQTGKVHVVRRGDTLSLIATLYQVTVADMILANGLKDANRIFSGQRLLIPVPDQRPLMPTPPPLRTPTSTPAATALPGATTVATPTIELTLEPTAGCPAGCEAISIGEPARGVTITSPLTVTGASLASEQILQLRVLDATGYEIGLGTATIDGLGGEIGFYTGTISFTVPANTQPGRIQVYSISPSDGAIEHLASVVVTLAGSGLDTTIERVKEAIESQDYETLANSMSDPFALAFYRSEGLSLAADKAIQELQESYLGPGDVFVDLSVDARGLFGDQAVFSPDVTQVVYSTGWGPDQADDALLLFETDATGQTRWGGMLYIFDALKDYPAPARP